MKKAILIISALALGLCIGLALSVKPWKEFNEQRAKKVQAVADMKAAEDQRADLMKSYAKLRSSIGMEELARKANYHKPGEVSPEAIH